MGLYFHYATSGSATKGGAGGGGHRPPPPFFCVAKKKENQEKKERFSKQKLLKGCHQDQNFAVLAILDCLDCLEKCFLLANHGGRQYFSVFHGPCTLKSISPALYIYFHVFKFIQKGHFNTIERIGEVYYPPHIAHPHVESGNSYIFYLCKHFLGHR